MSPGNDTEDQIFFLSLLDTKKTTYGFEEFDFDDEGYLTGVVDSTTRVAKVTEYAKTVGASESLGNGGWLLRTPGGYPDQCAYITVAGAPNISGCNVLDPGYGVRPAFNLGLNSVLFASAGKEGK